MSKQANLKSYFLKPSGSKDGCYDNESETEMQSDSEVTETAADDIVAPAGEKNEMSSFPTRVDRQISLAEVQHH